MVPSGHGAKIGRKTKWHPQALTMVSHAWVSNSSFNTFI